MSLKPTIYNVATAALVVLIASSQVSGEDWTRFRGDGASGFSAKAAPVKWSPKENIAWTADLPGAGVSCPIIVGDKIFVTCYSGYGVERGKGELEDLARHLVCVDRKAGKILWERSVDSETPEDRYAGMGVPEHGYASHTPVSDGKNIYCFFGKSGVYAYDLDGKELWNTSVGTESDDRRWGSASSPILHKDTLIVPAIAESGSLVGLDKNTGKELWKQEADGLRGSWSTPLMVNVGEDRSDLVIGVPYEVWGLNPATGKLRWYFPVEGRSFYTSVTAKDDIVYGAIGGRDGGCSFAVKAGGDDDASKTHKVWEGRDQCTYATPVIHDGIMFFVSSGVANVIDAKTGERIKRFRLKSTVEDPSDSKETGEGKADSEKAETEPPRRARRGGRSLDYSSPVIANDKIYYVKRNGEMHVLSADKECKQLAVNRVTDSAEEFSASPAICDGQIFFRSNKKLYCVKE